MQTGWSLEDHVRGCERRPTRVPIHHTVVAEDGWSRATGYENHVADAAEREERRGVRLHAERERLRIKVAPEFWCRAVLKT
jgi:hypothetical protein